MISLVPDHYSFTENSEAIVLCSSSFGKFSLLDKVPKEQKIHSAPPNAVIQSSRLFLKKKKNVQLRDTSFVTIAFDLFVL